MIFLLSTSKCNLHCFSESQNIMSRGLCTKCFQGKDMELCALFCGQVKKLCKTQCKIFIRCLLNTCNFKNQRKISVPQTTDFLKALDVHAQTCFNPIQCKIESWGCVFQDPEVIWANKNLFNPSVPPLLLQKGFQPNVINSWCCWLFNEWISHCCGLQYNYRKFGATWLQQYTSLSESWR